MRANKLETALSRDHLYSLSGPTRYVFFMYMDGTLPVLEIRDTHPHTAHWLTRQIKCMYIVYATWTPSLEFGMVNESFTASQLSPFIQVFGVNQITHVHYVCMCTCVCTCCTMTCAFLHPHSPKICSTTGVCVYVCVCVFVFVFAYMLI